MGRAETGDRKSTKGDGCVITTHSKSENYSLNILTYPAPREGVRDVTNMTSDSPKLAYLHEINEKTVSLQKKQLLLNS